MKNQRSLLMATRWPLSVLGVAIVAIGVAFALDQTSAREHALTIGAPAMTLLLPLGLVWLAIALTVHSRRPRSSTRGTRPA